MKVLEVLTIELLQNIKKQGKRMWNCMNKENNERRKEKKNSRRV
jgi:hypothetical protein